MFMDSTPIVEPVGRPLISVIVPIYNVASYLRKCLDSLKNQTMKQIEVICIDDGSTDGSGEIAEKYVTVPENHVASENPGDEVQFRIIHTENRGLSTARNRGIDDSYGEWLMFVDSDDWVSEDFCDIPYRAAVENGADLVIFDADREINGKSKHILDENAPTGIIDEFTAYKYGRGYAWNKLYHRSLFQSIRYPIGRVFEDGSATHKLVHIANNIVLLNDCLYHYVDRKDSISHTHTVKNIQDRFITYLEEYDDLVLYGYSDEKRRVTLCSYAIGFLSVASPSEDELYRRAEKIVDSIEGIPKTLSFKKKIALIVWKINPRLLDLSRRLIGRMA